MSDEGGDAMARGLAGADSSTPVTASLIQTATQLFGETPALWGRYFTSPETYDSDEYRHAEESAVLGQAGVRLLPIARQTTHVGGSEQQGAADAQANVDDIFDSFGTQCLAAQGGELLLFLDVEGSPSTGSPSLSPSYYTGWAQALMSYSRNSSNGIVTILPCVYARQGDDPTWNVLATATGADVQCAGAWVARYYYNSCAMTDWDDSIVLPAVQLPFGVFLWQYAENCCSGAIDCNQTNPGLDIQTALLNRLITCPS
jgi:hypothetical protein